MDLENDIRGWWVARDYFTTVSHKAASGDYSNSSNTPSSVYYPPLDNNAMFSLFLFLYGINNGGKCFFLFK